MSLGGRGRGEEQKFQVRVLVSFFFPEFYPANLYRLRGGGG